MALVMSDPKAAGRCGTHTSLASSLTLPKQPHAAGSCLGQTEQDGRDV